MQQRRNDKLASLPPEDREKLDAWLKKEPYRRVVDLAAAPPPKGLGLRTNIRALSRYFNKFLAPSPVDEINDLALHNPAAAEAAATTLLLQHSVQAALKSERNGFDHRKFNALLRLNMSLQRKSNSQQWLQLQKDIVAFRASTQK